VTKLKKQKSENVRVLKKTELPAGKEYPAFSFRYMTTNKDYNFQHFKNDTHNAMEASHFLVSKLMEVSQHNILELLSWGKERGFETIPHVQIRKEIFVDGIALPDDDKLYILRFGHQDYRMICFKQPDANGLFHIVLLDFDHSAYAHG
jgi:hypothetical protein